MRATIKEVLIKFFDKLWTLIPLVVSCEPVEQSNALLSVVEVHERNQLVQSFQKLWKAETSLGSGGNRGALNFTGTCIHGQRTSDTNDAGFID